MNDTSHECPQHIFPGGLRVGVGGRAEDVLSETGDAFHGFLVPPSVPRDEGDFEIFVSLPFCSFHQDVDVLEALLISPYVLAGSWSYCWS